MTKPSPDLPALIGESPAFQAMLEHVSKAAPLNKPTLVIGERGTGKELVAARLHYLSRRWDRSFVKLNCGALAESLLESELFGHEAGAFTGAVRRHVGRFELADDGTLFLDEIANATPAVQEKMLRVIEYGEFERVGGNQTLATDVRLIGATNADLPALATNRQVPRRPARPAELRRHHDPAAPCPTGGHPRPGRAFRRRHGARTATILLSRLHRAGDDPAAGP